MITSIFTQRDKNVIINTVSDLIRTELVTAIENLGLDFSKIDIDLDYDYIRVLIKMNELNGEKNIQLNKILNESICS